MIHFVFIFVHSKSKCPTFVLSQPCVLEDCSFSTELSWAACQKSFDHKCDSLSLDSQVYFIDQYIYPYANITLS